MQLPFFLVASAAVAPGVHAWWTGRSLIARTADPAFPELLLARRQRIVQIVAVGIALLIVFATEHAVWAVPALIIAVLVGGFSFRRTLYGETWTLPEYLPYVVASAVGGVGFWMSLAFAPPLIVALVNDWAPVDANLWAGVLGVVVGVALLAWERAYPRVWLAAHRATLLARDDLASRFDAIVERAGIRRPGVFRYGAAGSYAMNAFALPSTDAPRVALGDTLLELLTPDEVAAIFAHEVAHLEHFDRKVLRRFWIMTKVLLVGAVALPAALYAVVPENTMIFALVWPFIVLGILVWRFSRSQAHETDSDRRGAQLTGDVDAMISALTKLHHYSRLPRRWPYEFERTASHPSLARRIQALRADRDLARSNVNAAAIDPGVASLASTTAGATPAAHSSAPIPTVLRSTTRGRFIVLDATRAYWFDGVPDSITTSGSMTLDLLREHAASYRAVAYVDLAELRVSVTVASRALVARDRSGKRWSLPLDAAEVAAAQRALDTLDGQLATSARRNWTRSARLVAAVSIVGLLGLADFGWAWIPMIITLFVPSAWSLAALGSLILGRSVLVIAGLMAGHIGEHSWVFATLSAACGVWACSLAWRWATSDEPPRARRMKLAALAAASGVALVSVQGFIARPMRLARSTATPTEMGVVSLNDLGYGVSISPNGSLAAINMPDSAGQGASLYQARHELTEWTYVIAGHGGIVRSTNAYALAFADNENLLTVRVAASSDDSMVVSLERVGGDTGGWQHTIPAFTTPEFAIDRASRRWALSGQDPVTGDMIIVAGSTMRDSLTVTRQPYYESGSLFLHAFGDGSTLVSRVMPAGGPWVGLAVLGGSPMNSPLEHSVGGQRRPIGMLAGYADCGKLMERYTVHCTVRQRARQSLWRIDADSASLTLLGNLPPQYDLWSELDGSTLAGGSRGSANVVLVDLAKRTAVRFSADDAVSERRYIWGIATAGGTTAVLLTRGDRTSEVRFYGAR